MSHSRVAVYESAIEVRESKEYLKFPKGLRRRPLFDNVNAATIHTDAAVRYNEAEELHLIDSEVTF